MMFRTVAAAFLALQGATVVVAFNAGAAGKARSRASEAPKAIAIPMPDIGKDKVSTSSTSKPKLASESAWVANLDYEEFGKDVTALGKQLIKDQGKDDVEHLNKILDWRNKAALLGIATMWLAPNPITVAALSTWTYASWTMIAHHTCHGGYNRVDAGKYNSRGFALGNVVKRVQDWCDWMMPEAWNIEHNRLHHYHLGELEDPDLVQRNLQFLRDMDAPMPLKYAMVAGLAPIWKWFYYAPNTFKELQIQKYKNEQGELPANVDPLGSVTIGTMLFPKNEREKAFGQILKPAEFFTTVLGPFLLSRFLLLPAPLLAIPGFGPALFGHAVVNLLLADLLTNIHGFVTIVTNHAGEDIYTFEDEVKPKSGAFYVRQIIGSTNYDAGNDLVDFSHGWLNYQIEHHVWPDLSMLQYQRGAPQLKAICEKHGVPYVQESVWTRLAKTVDIMVGKTTMREFPVEYEPLKDKARNGVTWKSTNGAIDE